VDWNLQGINLKVKKLYHVLGTRSLVLFNTNLEDEFRRNTVREKFIYLPSHQK
jgi:hypothetical protein